MEDNQKNEVRHAGHSAHSDFSGIHDQLIFHLRDLSHTMRSLYEGKGSQKRVLIILDEIGGAITQQKLTERLGIQPGSASEVIAKLERAGYLERTPSQTDRRTADIRLTESGKAQAAQAREQRRLRHEQMFSCLSDGEKEELLLLLERINSDWSERYHGVEAAGRPWEHHHSGHGHRQNHAAKRENP